MTAFGRALDGGQIAGLIFLISALALWLIVYGRQRGYARWFRQWEADRKARRDAELAAERGDDANRNGPATGPWG